MSLPYTALLTLQECADDQIKVLSKQVAQILTNGTPEQRRAERAILQSTGIIENYLNRNALNGGLIVRKYTQPLCPDDCLACCGAPCGCGHGIAPAENRYYAWARHYPILQVETVGVTIHQDGRRFLMNACPSEITYYAGYRREDQSLAYLKALSRVPGLNVLPSVLPYDIQSVAFEIWLHKMLQRERGLVGFSEREVNIGEMKSVSHKADQDFVSNTLQSIHQDHRFLAWI